MNQEDSLTEGFRDVDATNLAKILRCLDTLGTMDSVREYKQRALEALNLRPEASALDIACGRGDDVAAMKQQCRRAVGLDLSQRLLNEAGTRHPSTGCEFQQGNAHALPFNDATFDAVRVDRSLQHMAGPGEVIREMARVARPGGVVLCAEPDWGTFLLGGPHSEAVDRIQQHWIRSFRNPWIGRELSTFLDAAGVVDRQCLGVWLSTTGFTESDILFEIARTVEELGPEDANARDWLDSYKQGEAYAGVLVMICWGRKPQGD